MRLKRLKKATNQWPADKVPHNTPNNIAPDRAHTLSALNMPTTPRDFDV